MSDKTPHATKRQGYVQRNCHSYRAWQRHRTKTILVASRAMVLPNPS